MKVVAINGSAREKGNTSIMIEWLFEPLQAKGIQTELIEMAGKSIGGCIACYQCFAKADRRCHGRKDDFNSILEKMLAADAIVLASPTYFANLTPEIKAVIDRAGLTAIANKGMFARKVGAAVAVARRGGAIHTFDSLNHFFFISEMIVPGANYWNMGFGLEKGDVNKDEEAKITMHTLGANMAWLLEKIGG